jgi:hypothetical protein
MISIEVALLNNTSHVDSYSTEKISAYGGKKEFNNEKWINNQINDYYFVWNNYICIILYWG